MIEETKKQNEKKISMFMRQYSYKASATFQQPTQNQRRRTSQVIRLDPNFSNYNKILILGKGNNSELIKQIFQKKNWKILPSSGKSDVNFHLKWIQSYNLLPYEQMFEGSQLCNHIQNIDIFTSKTGLIDLIKTAEENQTYQKMHSSSFFPETYILHLDQQNNTAEEENFLQETKNEGIWIHKPWNLNCGGGIKIVANLYKFKKELQTLKKDSEHIKKGQKFYSEYFSDLCLKSVIQKYIDDPLLINGKKFDIRCYLLIACTNPLIVFYHSGYLRISMEKYSNDGVEDNKNVYTHLTNAAIQKHHKNYEQFKEDTIWSMDQYQEYCKKKYQRTQDQIQNQEESIKRLLTYVVHLGESKLQRKLGCFELMGVDILIRNNFKPYLLELNSNPAIDCDTKVKQRVIPNVVENALNLVLEIHDNPLKRLIKMQNIQKSLEKQMGDFQLLINEQTQYSYIDYYQELNKIQQIQN